MVNAYQYRKDKIVICLHSVLSLDTKECTCTKMCNTIKRFHKHTTVFQVGMIETRAPQSGVNARLLCIS